MKLGVVAAVIAGFAAGYLGAKEWTPEPDGDDDGAAAAQRLAVRVAAGLAVVAALLGLFLLDVRFPAAAPRPAAAPPSVSRTPIDFAGLALPEPVSPPIPGDAR